MSISIRVKDIKKPYDSSYLFNKITRNKSKNDVVIINQKNYIDFVLKNVNDVYKILEANKEWDFYTNILYGFVALSLVKFPELNKRIFYGLSSTIDDFLDIPNLINGLIKFSTKIYLKLALKNGYNWDSETGTYLIKYSNIEIIKYTYKLGFRFKWWDFELSFYYNSKDIVDFMFDNKCEYKNTLLLAAFSSNNEHAFKSLKKIFNSKDFFEPVSHCPFCYRQILMSGKRFSSSFNSSTCYENEPCNNYINNVPDYTKVFLGKKIKDIKEILNKDNIMIKEFTLDDI